jgi:hypothetical protein
MSLTAAGVVYTLTGQLSADRERFEAFTPAAFEGAEGGLLWSRPVRTGVVSILAARLVAQFLTGCQVLA